MVVGTTRKPQSLTRKNASPASSVLRQQLGGFAPDPASYIENMPQFSGAPVPTSSPLSQGFSQAPSPQGLMGLINNINGLVAQSQQQFQAGRNQSPVNWRYPTQSPLVRSPIANQQSMLAGQASTITGMQQAEAAGRGWMLTGNRGDMPTFVPRRDQSSIDAEFAATHMDGLRDKALDPRNLSSPLTLKTPGGRMVPQYGYIDERGQKTSTNRLGALRQLAKQNPEDREVMAALAAAESIYQQQMADRSSPETVAANQAKMRARNDAKRGRAQRQAQGLRNMFGYGPQSPLARKANQQPTDLSSPLSTNSRTIESQTQSAARIAMQAGSPHIQALGVTSDSGVLGLHEGIQRRLNEDPNAEFSDESLKVYQSWAREHANLSTNSNDYFNMGDGEANTLYSEKWKELASLPDNERARKNWWSSYVGIQKMDTGDLTRRTLRKAANANLPGPQHPIDQQTPMELWGLYN